MITSFGVQLHNDTYFCRVCFCVCLCLFVCVVYFCRVCVCVCSFSYLSDLGLYFTEWPCRGSGGQSSVSPPPTAEARARFQASSCGIYVGKSVTLLRIPRSIPLPISFHQYPVFVLLSPKLHGHKSPSRLFSLLERATLKTPPMQLSCSLYYTKISCYFASIYDEILLILPPLRVCWLCALSHKEVTDFMENFSCLATTLC